MEMEMCVLSAVQLARDIKFVYQVFLILSAMWARKTTPSSRCLQLADYILGLLGSCGYNGFQRRCLWIYLSRVVTVFCDESAKWEYRIHLFHVHKFKCFKTNLQSAFKLDLSKRNLTKPDTHYWQLASLRLCVAECAAGVDGIMYS